MGFDLCTEVAPAYDRAPDPCQGALSRIEREPSHASQAESDWQSDWQDLPGVLATLPGEGIMS